jgi:O-antigen/teichoic acid export membrane protein
MFLLNVSMMQRLLSSFRGENLTARLVRAALGVGGLKLLYMPLTLLTSIVLARGLGPAGYGQYSFVLAVISLLSLPVGSGLAQLVTREVAKYHHDEEWGQFRGLIHRARQWIIIVSAVIAGIIVLLAAHNALWAVDDRWTLLFLGTLMLPLLGLNSLQSATLRGLGNVFYAQLPEMSARPGLNLVLAGGLLASGMLNPASALVSQVAATALAFGLGAWFLWRMKPAEVDQALPHYQHFEWGRALMPFFLLAAVGTLNGQLGILALGWLGTNEDVATFKVAVSGAMLVMSSLSIVNMVIGPHITRAHRDNDLLRLQRFSRQSARAALAVSLPFAVLLIFFGGPIIEILYGGAYRSTATLPLAILAFGQLVNVAFGSVGLFLTMCGFERDTLIGQTSALLVNFIAAALLIPYLGAVGAALSVVIGIVVWNVILTIRFLQRLGFRPSAF